MYSQNNEEKLIVDYFSSQDPKTLAVLDIGANDGKTFSNSLKVIELGWTAYLVEPSPKAFKKLSELHAGNERVKCCNYAISKESGFLELHESSSLITQDDVALVSSLIESETTKWKESNIGFEKVRVEAKTFTNFLWDVNHQRFDLINIDVEGVDYDVLTQIPLTAVDCQMLIIEFNGKEEEKYVDYCKNFGMRLVSKNPENLIFTR